MQGGDWKSTFANDFNTLDQRITRQGLFFRSSYEIGDGVEAFIQAQSGFALQDVANRSTGRSANDGPCNNVRRSIRFS